MKKEEYAAWRGELMERLELEAEVEDDKILELIDELIIERGRAAGLTLDQKSHLRQELFYSVRKLDVLQELLEDDTVTEIMVNGPEKIFLERQGKLALWEKTFSSGEKLEDVIQQIVGRCNRVVNEASPIVDARLKTGERVNVVLPPIALDGPVLTIRRFPKEPLTMEKLVRMNSLTEECAQFMEKLVKARYSLVIGGGTGSGKTTFLGALSGFIPSEERIITIEDNAELQLPGLPNLVRMEARQANLEGKAVVTIRDLIRTALRMRPNRIIVGEVRGGELFDALTAFNSGHDGSMLTAHANSPKDMLSRLETMVLMGMELPLDAIRRQISAGIDVLIHLGRMPDGSRKLMEISEVLGYEKGEFRLQPLFVRNQQKLMRVNSLSHKKAGVEL
ncbi:MAG: CpaF family protein [Blautia sp.]|jgi:pilus assembly protein CpaF